MKKVFIIVVMALAAISVLSQRTSRRPKGVVVQPTVELTSDTIFGNPGTLRLSGFDKPLRSRKETFFATNTDSCTVSEMAVTLVYYDAKGRQLHRRHLRVRRHIEPGQTLQISIPTWDIQQSFYYTLSEKPKRVEQATPFNVSISVDTLFIER